MSFFPAKQSNGLKEEKSIHSKVSTCKQTIKCPYTPKLFVPLISARIGFHASHPQGCTQVSPNETSTLITSTNCSYVANENQGCIVMDPSTASFGAGFANVSGGTFVTEFATTGIRYANRPWTLWRAHFSSSSQYMVFPGWWCTWFGPWLILTLIIQRSQIPSALSSNESTIDTSTFGIPVGNWPNTGCNIQEFFQPQQLILDITLCGGASFFTRLAGDGHCADS
jgi:hypothetical protein